MMPRITIDTPKKVHTGSMVLSKSLAVQATMIIKMRDSYVMRYLKYATTDMYRNNLLLLVGKGYR
jgi:hypothetical protein